MCLLCKGQFHSFLFFWKSELHSSIIFPAAWVLGRMLQHPWWKRCLRNTRAALKQVRIRNSGHILARRAAAGLKASRCALYPLLALHSFTSDNNEGASVSALSLVIALTTEPDCRSNQCNTQSASIALTAAAMCTAHLAAHHSRVHLVVFCSTSEHTSAIFRANPVLPILAAESLGLNQSLIQTVIQISGGGSKQIDSTLNSAVMSK